MESSANASPPGATIIDCRRCGERFSHTPGKLLASCPKCGASPSPLRKHFRHNGVAASLSLLALIVLVVGLVTPFISMSKLGTVNRYSLVGGIVELFKSGNTFIGTILLAFSVIFPIVKLVMLLVATSALAPVSARARHAMHKIAVATGKYSLLDVLVIAVMIVIVKFGDFAEVRALPGTVLFCVAVLLSIVAGLCVNFDDEPTETDGR